MFEVNTIVLEGPDLSGKTSLYNTIHKKTQFRWNIQDRSSLSMVCYARQFERCSSSLKSNLKRDLCNLNNLIVILLPSFSVLERRYNQRGDEVQDLESLQSLYKIFTNEVEKIEGLPNVLVLRHDQTVNKSADEVIQFVRQVEQMTMPQVGGWVSKFVKAGSENEYCLDIRKTGPLLEYPDDIMKDPLEGEYYTEILWDFENVIRKEMRGLNPYNKKQGFESRRFYYSSESCISSIHLMPRGDLLKCYVVFRSTNAVKNAHIDLEFVQYLVHKLGRKYFLKCKNFDVSVRLNSAHVL